MTKSNNAKNAFIREIAKSNISGINARFQNNMCFSLEYFDKSQSAGQDFKDWTNEQLLKLIEKIRIYCQQSIADWRRMRVGKKSNTVLEVYGAFPTRSEFAHPKIVPENVEWARFRLEGDMRLIGFVLPHEFCTQYGINKNTFYIVFLDNEHRFYKT